MRYSNLPCSLLALCLLMASCRPGHQEHDTGRGFYYWKSVAALNGPEQAAIEKWQVQKIYIKFFDVLWNAPRQTPVPVAKVRFADSTLSFLRRHSVRVIPTVFITNESLQNIDPVKTIDLARRIIQLLQATILDNDLSGAIDEVQIDCDWTASTKEKYFSLLQTIRDSELLKGRALSATIRLYQCKYSMKTGVPPVQRGLLMCYNMGNLKDPHTTNSIIDPAELKKYIGQLHRYPLPLDIGLPLFQWKVLYRNGQYKGLLQELPDSLLLPAIANRKGNTFEILKDTLIQQYELKKADLVRQEDSNFGSIMQAAGLLKPQLATRHFSVVLFHLDPLTLHSYTDYELEKIFNSLR